MHRDRPTFYQRQILWKKNREEVLQNERNRKAQEIEEIEEIKRNQRTNSSVKKQVLNSEKKFSKMKIILEDLDRVNNILANEQ